MSKKKKKKFSMDMVSQNVDFEKAMESQEVLNGVVMRTEMRDIGPAIIVRIDDKDVFVPQDQLESHKSKRHMGDLVGTVIHVLLTGKETETLYYGSYSLACKKLAEPVIERLKNGEEVKAIVRELQPYGVFVSLAEQTYALMRNSGCVTGIGYAQDYLKKGQLVNVKLTNLADDGKMTVELAEKIETPQLSQENTNGAKIYRNQVILGKVIKATHRIIVVDLIDGVTGTANPNKGMPILENSMVRYLVTDVRKDGGAVAGRILAVI